MRSAGHGVPAGRLPKSTKELAARPRGYDTPFDILGVELNTNYRNAMPGSYTEAYRLMFTWTHRFEKTPVAKLGRAPLGPAPGTGMLEEIDQRQRLALLLEAGAIERAGLVIDFDDVGSVNTVAQTFERVRQALIRRYGNPSSVFNRGEFRAQLVDDAARLWRANPTAACARRRPAAA